MDTSRPMGRGAQFAFFTPSRQRRMFFRPALIRRRTMQVVRVSQGKLKRGTWNDFEAAFREAVAPPGAATGLLARSLARDLDDPDIGCSISIWESESAIREFEASPRAKMFREKLEPFYSGNFTTRLYELHYWDV